MPTRSEPEPLNPNPSAAAGRSFAYRYLAEAFAHPEQGGWLWAGSRETGEALSDAVARAWPGRAEIAEAARAAWEAIRDTPIERARAEQLRTFGYTIRGACPPHEIEYGDTKADALFRPHRLADLSSLYRVFGLDLDEATHERGDHLTIECEFASILAARAAHALEERHAEGADACEGAWRLFLREHLGRWTPAFASRLRTFSPSPWLAAATGFLLAVVRADCAVLGIRPGAADIQLVSYDETDGAFCTEECGLAAPSPSR